MLVFCLLVGFANGVVSVDTILSAGLCSSDKEPTVHCDSDEDESALLQTASSRHANILARKDSKRDIVDFKVLVVGAPRTGTQSLHTALERLGYNPWHSGYQPLIRPPLCDYVFGSGADSSLNDALEMMEGYDAGMDEPFQFIYETVMDRWPKSKFILTVTDPEHWFESYELFFRDNPDIHDNKWWRIAERIEESDSLMEALGLNKTALDNCNEAVYWGCNFSSRETALATKQQCIAGFQAHYDRVRKVIPAGRLLEFNLSDGYAPLATFLGQEVPMLPNGTVEPFPYTERKRTGSG